MNFKTFVIIENYNLIKINHVLNLKTCIKSSLLNIYRFLN